MLLKKFLYVVAVTTSLFSVDIKEFVLCDHIENREPKDIINTSTIDASPHSLYAFLNVSSSQTAKLFMVWKKNDKEHFRFPVDLPSSPRCRVWSCVQRRSGQWSVHIENDKKEILKDITFTIQSNQSKNHEEPVTEHQTHHVQPQQEHSNPPTSSTVHPDHPDEKSKIDSPLRSLENPKN
jgi:hypothetical protein